MKGISFQLTLQQIRARTKDVTRRMGFLNVKVGDKLAACEKCQGIKKGEKRVMIGVIEVVSVRREPLDDLTNPLSWSPGYGLEEVKREGFPNMTPQQFVAFFCQSHAKCTPETVITRIEFRYL